MGLLQTISKTLDKKPLYEAIHKKNLAILFLVTGVSAIIILVAGIAQKDQNIKNDLLVESLEISGDHQDQIAEEESQ